MAGLYIYLVALEILAMLLMPGSEACSCGSICSRYQSEMDRCRCCHYYQVGGKRSAYDSPQHHKQNTASPEFHKQPAGFDNRNISPLNSEEEMIDPDIDLQEKRLATWLNAEPAQTPFTYFLLLKKQLKSRQREQERSWPDKTGSEELFYFMPDFVTRSSDFNPLPSHLVPLMTRKR